MKLSLVLLGYLFYVELGRAEEQPEHQLSDVTGETEIAETARVLMGFRGVE